MRVTSYILGQNFIYNLNMHLSKMNEYQNQVSSGKKLNRVSDDPPGSSMVLELKSSISDINQYIRNIDDGLLRLNMTEDVLNNVHNMTQRARDIGLMAANSTMNEQDRKTMAIEVDQLLEELVTVANKESVDGYLFGGTQVDTPPFDVVRDENGTILSVATHGNIEGQLKRVVSKGEPVVVNIDIDGIFKGDNNLFNALISLRDALENDDTEKISNAIGVLNDLNDSVVSKISEIGGRVNFLSDRKSDLEMQTIHLSERISDIEDADLAESLIYLQQEEVAYQAALTVGNQILQSTLQNYLK